MMTIVHELLSLLLFYSCFCRAVKMDTGTLTSVRIAFWLLSATSVVCIFAPLAWLWEPDGVSIALLAAIVVVQLVTSQFWREGVPYDFKERGATSAHS